MTVTGENGFKTITDLKLAIPCQNHSINAPYIHAHMTLTRRIQLISTALKASVRTSQKTGYLHLEDQPHCAVK